MYIKVSGNENKAHEYEAFGNRPELRFFEPLFMKKILLITDFFRPEPGGLEGFFTGVARQWDKGRIEVLIPPGSGESTESTERRRVFDSGESYPIHRRPPHSFRLKFWKEMEELSVWFADHIVQSAAQHVILGQISRASRIAAKSASDAGLHYSIFLNGNDFKNRLAFHRVGDRRLVLGAKNVFTLSRFLARGGREFGIHENRVCAVPPGLDIRWDENKRYQLPEKLRERVKGKVVILGLGPFLPRKGLDQAIEAFYSLEEKEKAHLLLVGSGPEYGYLEELIRIRGLDQHATLTGFLSDDELAGALNASDIFIQPGAEREDDLESLGTALMEASWFGIPSIAGNVGSVEEIVRQGVSGFVVKPGDVRDIAAKLRELIVSTPLRRRLGENAKEIAQKEYDLGRTCAAIDVRL